MQSRKLKETGDCEIIYLGSSSVKSTNESISTKQVSKALG